MIDEGTDKTVPALENVGASGLHALSLEGDERYVDLGQLGAGGMGEVRLIRDRRLDREVALKRVRNALRRLDFTRRFLREVRVQGQLDHPSVVPVYELGVTPDGDPYFTMKRVRGHTLSNVLRAQEAGDLEMTARFSRWRLLSAFNTVCLAIDSAHKRGVLHRDLKPANIMLGEFGEVHVLDWGLARVRGQKEESVGPPIRDEADGSQTAVGSAMGTPGYMSPEQAQGFHDILDERADVFSLGVILREILERGAGAKTPTGRAIVPQELELIWRHACEPHPRDRYASARELADAVERYLDGQRDEERRRELADKQLELAAATRTNTYDGRGRALKALGRALALDPTNGNALRQLSALLAEPPVDTPPDAQTQLEALADERNRQMLSATSLRLFSWALGLSVAMAVLGVHSVVLAGSLLGLLLAGTAVTWWFARHPQVSSLQNVAALVSLCCISALAVLVGPLVVIPTLAATHAMLFAANSSLRARLLMLLAATASVVGPVVLQPFGPYVQAASASLVITSPLLSFQSPSTPLVLVLMSLVPVITPTMLVGRLFDAFVAAERKVIIQSAALSQLIPTSTTDRRAGG